MLIIPHLCSSSPIFSAPLSFSTRHLLPLPTFDRWEYSFVSQTLRSCSHFLQYHRLKASHVLQIASKDTIKTYKSADELIEVGFLSGVHGLHGEICVKPKTDFPELRFSKPGRRWLRQRVAGKDTIQEVELIEGRSHAGRKTWILKFEGFDSVDQVRLLVGSTLLADENDRPELGGGEFYTHDLIGMRVVLKESGQHVGTVVNVYDTGANDLLHVRLDSYVPTGSTDSELAEADRSAPLVWIPFVEAIVPDIDLHTREMQITPPKGLLEVNLRSSDISKKQRRQLEWKARKIFQKRLIAAKKKLSELEQKHIFDGFRFGEKSQRTMLAEQIVGVNTQLLQLALQNIERSPNEWNPVERIDMPRTRFMGSSLKLVLKNGFASEGNVDELCENFNFRQNGKNLLSKGAVSICLIVNGIEKPQQAYEVDPADPESKMEALVSELQAFFCDKQKFLKEEDRGHIPLILISPAFNVDSLQKLFLDNDYFGFEPEKVWFCQEEVIPVVSSSIEDQKKQKILMKTPWEILQSPMGSGGVPGLLSSRGILEKLIDLEVDFIQICNTKTGHVGVNPTVLGFLGSKKSEIGVQIPEDLGKLEENVNIMFSSSTLRKLANEINNLRFYAVQKSNSYVEKVDKEWINVVPGSPNSFELRASIYSYLETVSPDKISLIEVID